MNDFEQGLGQYNVTWANLVLQALTPYLPHVLWILPQAWVLYRLATIYTQIHILSLRPNKPVACNHHQIRPSWFNIWQLPPQNDEYDEIGTSESIEAIENIILAQVQSGIDSRRIVLCGFSQGAALSLMVGLTTLYELGGIISLSGWIPNRMRDVSLNSDIMLHNFKLIYPWKANDPHWPILTHPLVSWY